MIAVGATEAAVVTGALAVVVPPIAATPGSFGGAAGVDRLEASAGRDTLDTRRLPRSGVYRLITSQRAPPTRLLT